LVLGAKAVLAAGARKVLILDLDAHGGGGTYSLVKDDPRIAQIDIVTSPFDVYEPEDKRFYLELFHEGEKPGVTELTLLLKGFRQLDEIGFVPDLVIYNAGMDTYLEYSRDAAVREAFVFRYCSNRLMPIAFVLAGGYLGPNLDQDGLVALHRLTIEEAALACERVKPRRMPRHMRRKEREAREEELRALTEDVDSFSGNF
jgi:acetoin utilization deacetylase AcuC-like enzyme